MNNYQMMEIKPLYQAQKRTPKWSIHGEGIQRILPLGDGKEAS